MPTTSNALRLIPLGGLGEIGRNMTVFECQNDLIVVDAGLLFPEYDMPGVDYLIPNINYLRERANRIRGILITHAHEDHIGALPHILPQLPDVPVYLTRFSRTFVEQKLHRAGVTARLVNMKPGDRLNLGCFAVEPFHVTHSIPDAVGFAIHTPQGLVVMTGDYKLDPLPLDGWPTDLDALARYGESGVLALLADSTNADRLGRTPAEETVEPVMDAIMASSPGRVIVATFASLVTRIQRVLRSAHRQGRKVAVAGAGMETTLQIGCSLGYLDAAPGQIILLDEAQALPPNQVVIICTGSQGEPSSVIGRLASGERPPFPLRPDDTVMFSAHPIPGNEEDVYRAINRLLRQGVRVIGGRQERLHVSGHASQEEMAEVIHLVKPKYLIPVHGEVRHLYAHREIGIACGIHPDHILLAETGQIVEFVGGRAALGKRINDDPVVVTGGQTDVDLDTLRDRNRLAQDGVVTVSLVLDQNGRISGEPVIAHRGLTGRDDYWVFFALSLRNRIANGLNGDRTREKVEKAIAGIVREQARQILKRAPDVVVLVHEPPANAG